jgi:hypothetical protein
MATVRNNFDASIDFCHSLGPASPSYSEGHSARKSSTS